jgi:predicted PhzF superfamily epimerase YddE/YHI9
MGSSTLLTRRERSEAPPSEMSASQGRCVGRDGRVAIEFDDDTIWLGGHAVTCIEGWLDI